MPRPALAALILLTVLCAAPARESRAAWPHDPVNGGLLVGAGAGNQVYPSKIPDGAGGAFIAWHDSRSGGYDVYVQRVGPDGTPLWTPNGVLVCNAASDQANTALVSDGAGGVIVVWHDFRTGGASAWDIYAQRLNASGVAQWFTNGLLINGASVNQVNPVAVSDGAGGAIVAWTDNRNGTNDLYAQRISGAGVLQWNPIGVGITLASGDQGLPDLVSDGAGGAIVTWKEASTGYIAIQRVTAAGTTLWGVNGFAIDNGYPEAVPRITTDGQGGAIVVFHKYGLEIRAIRVTWAGTRPWGSLGYVEFTTAGNQYFPSIASDGQGGAFVAWSDYRSGNGDIYALRLTADGATHMSPTGVLVCDAPGDQTDAVVASSGPNQAFVAWIDRRSGQPDLYVQSLNPGGGWAADGVPVCTAMGDQGWLRLVADGAGGAIAAWHDARSGQYDVLAQGVERFGYLGSPQPVIVSVDDVPNDQGGRVQVEWTASYLDAWPDFAVESYSVWRQVPSSAAPMAAIEDGRFRRTVSATGAQAVYWEYLATLPARGFPGYSYVAQTTSDQLPGSNPYTSFMVLAEKDGGYPYWSSAPDSGYSIDNLAPAAPAPLTGSYAGGSTALHWHPNSEADFAEYRIYRGASADFVPGPGNQVATTPDTGHVDPAGMPAYYKVSAVDVHGNESAFSLLTPGGTLDAGERIALALSLAIPQPNPARHATSLVFDLPRAAEVSLVVHDAGGRLVRTMVRGRLDAGRVQRTWDLRDDDGAPVVSGLYFVRLEAEGRSLSRRIVAIR